MPNRPWKSVERRIARALGGERNPLSGGASRHTRGDALLPVPLYVEVKHGSSVPRSWSAIERLFADVETNARAEGKVPVLVLHPKRKNGVEEYPAYLRLFGPTLAPKGSPQWVTPWPSEGSLVCIPLRDVCRLVLGGRPCPA